MSLGTNKMLDNIWTGVKKSLYYITMYINDKWYI